MFVQSAWRLALIDKCGQLGCRQIQHISWYEAPSVDGVGPDLSMGPDRATGSDLDPAIRKFARCSLPFAYNTLGRCLNLLALWTGHIEGNGDQDGWHRL